MLRRTPVAYFAFNRPRHTRETFAALRAYRPAELFLIADGPRTGRDGEIERCQEVRRVVSEIDWPCAVHRNFSDRHLGLGRRVSSGLDWVFSQVERSIVLEDDCLASPDFFTFCDDLLDRYQNEDKVWAVSANGYQPEGRRSEASYFFSKYPDVWGWATWRRAWLHYRFDLPFLDEWIRSPSWRRAFPTRLERRHFDRVLHNAVSGQIDTWDYQWVACAIHAGGLTARPNANLVRNIGFDDDATHTKCAVGLEHDLTPLGPVTHPMRISADADADRFLRDRSYRSRTFAERVLAKVRRFADPSA